MSEKTGLDNITYDILSSLRKDADFLYDDIDKHIHDAETANESELVDYVKSLEMIVESM
ncbi:MAG TPA: hypothetical protein VF242_04505 [Nitrososphaeraceae archaeon]